MFKYFVIIIAFSAQNLFCQIQNLSRTDSLFAVKPLLFKNQLSWWYNETAQEFVKNQSLDTDEWFAKRALYFSISNKNNINIANSCYLLGKINAQKQKHNQSIEYLQKSIKYLYLADSSYNSINKEIIRTLKLQYKVYEEMQDFSKELIVLEKLIPLTKKYNDTTTFLEAVIYAAYIYADQGNASKGIAILLDGITIAEKSNNKLLLARIYNTLGYTYQYQKNLQQALKAYKIAYKISSENKEYMGSSICLINIGTIYHDLNKFDTSIFFLNQALQIQLEKVQDDFTIANIYANLTSNHTQKKNFAQALKYIVLAIDIYKKNQYQFGLSQGYYEIAFINFQMKNYVKAIEYANKAINICIANNFKQIELTTTKLLFKIYEENKSCELALKYHLLYHQLKDSINSTEVKNQIAALETQFEFDKKNAQITLLNNERQLQQNRLQKQKQFLFFLIGIGILLGIVIILIFSLLQHKIKTNKNLIEQRNIIIEQNEELRQQKEEINTQNEEINKQKNIIFKKIKILPIASPTPRKYKMHYFQNQQFFNLNFQIFLFLIYPKILLVGIITGLINLINTHIWQLLIAQVMAFPEHL